jgi:hypothetical protein
MHQETSKYCLFFASFEAKSLKFTAQKETISSR